MDASDGWREPDEWVVGEAGRIVASRFGDVQLQQWQGLWRRILTAWADRGLPDRAEVYRLFLDEVPAVAGDADQQSLARLDNLCWVLSDVAYRWVEAPLVLDLASPGAQRTAGERTAERREDETPRVASDPAPTLRMQIGDLPAGLALADVAAIVRSLHADAVRRSH